MTTRHQSEGPNHYCSWLATTVCLICFLACGHTASTRESPRSVDTSSTDARLEASQASHAISIDSPGLYPETLVYNSKNDTFLVGSVRNGAISAVSRSGAVTPLVEDPQLCSVLGIAVDIERGRLLATNSDLGVCLRPSIPGPKRLAALGIYDLATGKRLHYVDLGALLPSSEHLANGLALDTHGNAYVTDSFAPVIYKIGVDGSATIFLESDQFGGEGINLNGIAVHPNGYLLVVKKSSGQLFKVPLMKPQEFSLVAAPRPFVGGDGLILSQESEAILIANRAAGEVANSAYWLSSNDDWTTVELRARRPLGDVYPTTAANTPDGPVVLHTQLNELMAEAGKSVISLNRRAQIEDIPMSQSRTGKTEPETSGLPPDNPGAFVFAELHWKTPFAEAPWGALNASSVALPGFLNLTWLSAENSHSLGGLYSFDTVEHATDFVTGYFPAQARELGVSQTTRIFDAAATRVASREMQSAHFGSRLKQAPGAFVYTEVQVAVPFDEVPWQERNPAIRANPGFIAKTWLSGLKTQTVGGLYAFDTLENARAFALTFFANAAARQGAAYTARVFDAQVVAGASRAANSPFFQRFD